MTTLLILLTLPETVRMQYYNGIRARFPDIEIKVVDHHSKVEPYIADADVLVTFGPMMAEHVLEKAANLKWIQALGSGVDGITDRPALRSDVAVTNLHGIHGPPVSEAALMAMLALARGLPREIVAKLNQEVGAILALPEVRESLLKQGLVTAAGTLEDIAATVRSDVERWKKFIAETKIHAD